MLIFRGGGGIPFVPVSSSYEGLVGTRGQVLDVADSTTASFNSRALFYTFQVVPAIKVCLSNFMFVTTTGEAGPGGPVTVTASIEYPAGTFTRLLFGGLTQGVIADNSILFSDYATLSVPIQPATKAWLRVYGVTPSGAVYSNVPTKVAGSGEAMELSTGILADKTMGGTITNTNSTIFFPLGYIAPTSLNSMIMYGDSISVGVGNFVEDSFSNIGPPSRGLGTSFAYTKVAFSGFAMDELVPFANNTKLILPFANRFVTQMAVNDLVNGNQSTAQMLANLTTMVGWSKAAFPGTVKAYAGTMTMRTASPPPLALSGLTWSGGLATATSTAPHGMSGTLNVQIVNSAPAAYNGVFSCTVISTTQFTYPLASNPGVATPGGFVKSVLVISQQNNRSGYNNAVRVLASGVLDGFFEIANTVESSPLNSQFWADMNDTADGVHPTASGAAKETAAWTASTIT